MNLTHVGKNLKNSLIQSKPNWMTFSILMELVIQLYLYKWEEDPIPMRQQAKQIRQVEINECFLRNLFHPLINTIHVLCEDSKTKAYYTDVAKQHELEMKCCFVEYGKQPTYAELVEYVTNNIPENRIVCIQNSDIYIDHSLSKEFLETTIDPMTLVSLTRHEHTEEGHPVCNVTTCPLIWDYQGSHDTFLFRTPVPPNFPYESVKIPQNVYGAEAVFMKAWVTAGKRLLNPCFDINIFHRHWQRTAFTSYETVADGYLCHVNPRAPHGRDDIQQSLKTIFKD